MESINTIYHGNSSDNGSLQSDNESIESGDLNQHESEDVRNDKGKQAIEYEEPKIGMEFPNDDAAYHFYNNYAFHIGFSIRKNLVPRTKKCVVTVRTFTCNKEGFYKKKESNKPTGGKSKARLDERTGCEAHMKINLCPKGVYTITSFKPDHNHITATPSKRNLLKSQKKINDSQKAMAEIADCAGLKPKQTYDILAQQAGGRKHLCFLPTDYKNYLRSRRMRDMAAGDAGAILEYFQNRVKEDPSFYYAVQVDEDDQITNIFWADGRALLDYDCFGDVICFDTTYKTNEYGRPFAPFVGVNHHKQTVVFGAALLYDETIQSFEWVFRSFTHAVGGKAPKVVLIDQDAAMERAIANVWPNATHRLCVWHMYQNAAKHLSHVFNASKSFERDLSHCVYDCEYEEDFLESWNCMLERYDLSENKWLSALFEKRRKWALVYGRKVFCADMKSTQRSESLNSVIKRYLDPRQRLLDFFYHFERLVEERRHAELVSDFRASQGTPKVQYSDMLKYAARILTPSVFTLLDAEYVRFLNCSIYYRGKNGVSEEYVVIGGGSERRKEFTVLYDPCEDHFKCSCSKFEFVGIQCCHVLKALDAMNIKQLPEKYYLKRWRKDAKAGRKFVMEELSGSDSKANMSVRYNSLVRGYNSILSRASHSEKAYRYAFEAAEELMSNIEAILLEEGTGDVSKNNEDRGDSVLPHNVNPQGSSLVPKGIKRKDGGRGRRRYKGALDGKKRNKKQATVREKNVLVGENNSSSQYIVAEPPLVTSNSFLSGPYTQGSATELLNNAINGGSSLHATSSSGTGRCLGYLTPRIGDI